ncbi:MAG: zinc carboxypeptidase, partial [Bacteroidota bacterium]
DQRLDPTEEYTFAAPSFPSAAEAPYACVFGWESMDDARMVGKLLQAGIKVRFAGKPFAIDGQSFNRGSLIVTKGDNRKVANWYNKVLSLAKEEGVSFANVATGFSDNGPDLGSSSMQYMTPPKVMLFYGDGVDPNTFGQAWHYFEQVLEYPVAIAKQDKVSSIPWENYNVLVLPGGRYQWSESQREALQAWTRKGGRIIALGSAVGGFGDWPGAGIQRKSSGGESGEANTQDALPMYEEAERSFIPDFIPGAIFKVSVDASHPLGYGLGEHYFSLKTSSSAYSFLEAGRNVGTLGDELVVVGFAGYRAKNNQKQSLSFGIVPQGRGSIIYLVDNPLFRGFWQEGQRLFANALFFAGQ